MDGRELISRVRDGGYRPVVRMTKYGGDNLETCMNEPQMGRIVYAEIHHEGDGVYIIDIDLNEFDSYNDSVAHRNFYDRGGQPVLSAKEANCWPKNGIERVYLMLDDAIEDYFEIVGEGEVTVLILTGDERQTVIDALAVAANEVQINDAIGSAISERLDPTG